MSGIQRAREWLEARRRFQFVLTTTLVVVLTGLCAALAWWPDSTTTPQQPAATDRASSVSQIAAADPRLDEVRQLSEPFGPLRVEQVPTGAPHPALVVGHPEHRADIDLLVDELAAATASVTELWGPEWSRSPVVVVAATAQEFADLAHMGGSLPTEVAAVTVADPFVPGSEPTGQRVVFGPDAGKRLDDPTMRTMLRHEITHIATRADTVDGSPQWLLEGFAEYAAQRNTGRNFAEIAPTAEADIRAGRTPIDLPTDATFSGASSVAAYELAWSVSAAVADQYGEPALVALYHRLATGQQTPETEDTAFREVLGTTRAALVADWQHWLRAKAG